MIGVSAHTKLDTADVSLDKDEDILGLSLRPDFLTHELHVFWWFTWRDWSASMIPGSIYTVAALRSLDESLSLSSLSRGLARSIIYFLFFVYTFCLANQITGVAEDRINKPDRPLSSGLSSIKGAYVRLCVSITVLLALGAAWGVLPWAALWIANTLHASFFDGDKHWATKNLVFMSVASFCIVQAAWGMAAPITPGVLRWNLIFSGAFGAVASVQDLRDAEGDKVTGRRTLPIILGDAFRYGMAGVICVIPGVCWRLGWLNHSHWMVAYCGIGLCMAMFYMAYRVFVGSSAQYHHKTYMILTYIYCGCVAVPMLFP